MARQAPYARRLRGGILVIDGTTDGGVFDSDPRTWSGPPYALFDVEERRHVTPRLRALWKARLALRLAVLWAFVLGLVEFRRACTINVGRALMEYYDSGRDWAHRLTLRRYEG